MIIASGDGVYKLDYNKVLEYHIEKKQISPWYVKTFQEGKTQQDSGVIKMNEDSRIEEIRRETDGKAIPTAFLPVIYVIRRETADRADRAVCTGRPPRFCKRHPDPLQNLKRIYGYKIKDYWSNIASVDSYYKTNMDFLKPEVRDYFFHQYPNIYSKVDDNPPAKYKPGL